MKNIDSLTLHLTRKNSLFNIRKLLLEENYPRKLLEPKVYQKNMHKMLARLIIIIIMGLVD
nr:hypothetical protein VCHA53O474_30488 [Vibrio chagasii]